jgi:hypothetical protein
MSSVKISQLPVASTVSATADALPIVHAGVTQKVTPALLVQSVLPAPGAIGGTTPAAGSFTTLNASGAATINGTTIPAGLTLVTLAETQTLTSKTINLASNTLTGTLAQFNTACSDADFLSDSGSATLTNKTVNLANNTLSGTIAQFNTACSDADFATLMGSETLSNKTIGSSNSLSQTKLINNLSDVNGNELIKATATTSAVNEITVANAAVGNPPKISASGDDVNISLYLVAKGTGAVVPDSPFIGRRGIRSLSSTDGVGYFTGAGGTVTQTPNRTSTVTIDKICGQIITVSATTTAGLIVEFTVNNSTVAVDDTVIANIAGAPTGKYILNITRIVAGSFVVQTYTPAAVLGAEALTINFSVIRSVIS